MARHPHPQGCVNCSKALDHGHGEKSPPCMRLHQIANAGKTAICIFPAAKIGSGPCPWSAEWSELGPLLRPGKITLFDPPDLQHAPGYAAALLQALYNSSRPTGGDNPGIPKADRTGYVVRNGQRVYESGGIAFLVMVAKPNDHDWVKFSEEAKRVVTGKGHYDRATRYWMAVDVALKMGPGDVGAFLKEMRDHPENLGKAIAIFALFAAGTALFLGVGGIARVLAAIALGGLDAAIFAHCAKLGIDFVTKIEAAQGPDEIQAAGRVLYEFVKEVFSIAVPAGAGQIVARRKEFALRMRKWFFAKSREEWKQAAQLHEHATSHAKAPKLKRPDAAEAARGMWKYHTEAWGRWCKKHQTLAVLRAGNATSLPHHFTELITAKPMLVKWKTAKEGEFMGLVTVPSYKHLKGEKLKEFLELLEKYEKLGFRYLSPEYRGARHGPSTYSWKDKKFPHEGSLLIGPDGCAFCGDVDKMGLYQIKNGHAVKTADAATFNDNPAMVERLNNEVYHGPVKLDQHPGQDFYVTGVDANGKRKMGLQPGLTEKFVVVYPNGSSHVVNLTELKQVYKHYGIEWPYSV